LPKKTDQQWLRDQLDFVCSQADKVSHIEPARAQTYGLHTALKLGALNHSLNVFLPIARNQIDEKHTFGGAVYVDLFAGSGLTRVAETGDLVAGSPIIAAGNRRSFDQIICIEDDKETQAVLEQRLSEFRNRMYTILRGDCNEIAPTLHRYLRFGNPLAFVFIDPEGMEIKWRTLEALSRQFPYMDILMNFTYGAQRVLGDIRGGRTVNEQVMDEFAGPGWPMLLLSEDDTVVNFVEGKIATTLGRPLGDKVLVRDASNRQRYFLMVRMRRTGGGTPFLRGYIDMLRRISRLTVEDVRGVLNDRFGRSLTSFETSRRDD